MPRQPRRSQHIANLEDLLRFEILLTDLSAAFVSVPADKVDWEIERWLQRIVEFLGIERTMLAQFIDEEKDFRITHSYAKAGFTPAAEVIPRQEVPWHVKKILAGETIVLSRLDDIPASAARDKETARRFGVKSAVMVPLMVSGTAIGAMTFDALRRERSWPDDLVRRFRLLGEVFANALARKRAHTEREELLRFEGMVAKLSATFIHAPANAVDKVIEEALKLTSQFLGVDRTTVYEFSEDRTLCRATHSFAAPGAASAPTVVQRDEFPWFVGRLLRGEPIAVERPGDWAEEAIQERAYVASAGIMAIVAVPMAVGGSILGGVAWTSLRSPRRWSEGLVQRLRLIGEIFASALVRQRADEALRKSEVRFRKVLEAAPEGVLLVCRDGLISFANAVAGRIFGYESGELVGLHVDTLVPDRFRSAHAEKREEFLHDPTPREIGVRRNLYGLRKDATEFPVEIGLSLLETSEGPLVYCSVRDVTESRRAEAEALRLRDELAHVARVATMGELSASFAHELNQPLTAILSNAQAAQRFLSGATPDLAEVQEALRDIVQQGRRAGEVILRLRGLFRRRELTRAPLDLAEVIQEIAELLGPEARLRGIKVTLDIAPGLPQVPGDRIQVQQVLINLIMNAFDAIDRNRGGPREVLVRASHHAPGPVSVAVRDSGAGVSKKVMARMFDPFFTTKPGGMGMGLAISWNIVRAHGGTLWATPNPEQGITVEFNLP